MSRAAKLTRGALAAAWAFTLLPCTAQRAAAYSDFRKFAYVTSAGGGGGRFYTGSPADGYTCRICHQGGASPQLRVLGLPVEGYKAGTEYEITVDWWDGDALSTAIEITDSAGREAGSLRLPPEEGIQDPERCKQDPNEVIAAMLVRVAPPNHRSELSYFEACGKEDHPDDCRQVVSVPPCGSGRVRFAWRAPSAETGPVWFSGAVVASNDDGDTTGDGVAEIGTLVPSPSDPSAAVRTYAGCSLLPPSAAGRRPSLGAALVLLALGVVCRLTRRRLG